MGLICYIPKKHIAADRFLTVMGDFLSKDKCEIYNTFAALSGRVAQPFENANILVLMAADRGELSRIFSIRDSLLDIPMILILPDADKSTVERGHAMYPRFISYMDSNFMDVAAVLRKMLQVYQS